MDIKRSKTGRRNIDWGKLKGKNKKSAGKGQKSSQGGRGTKAVRDKNTKRQRVINWERTSTKERSNLCT